MRTVVPDCSRLRCMCDSSVLGLPTEKDGRGKSGRIDVSHGSPFPLTAVTTPGRTAKKFEIEGSVKTDSSTIRSGLSHAGHEVPHHLLHDIMMRFEVGAWQTQAPNISEARAFAFVALHLHSSARGCATQIERGAPSLTSAKCAIDCTANPP